MRATQKLSSGAVKGRGSVTFPSTSYKTSIAFRPAAGIRTAIVLNPRTGEAARGSLRGPLSPALFVPFFARQIRTGNN